MAILLWPFWSDLWPFRLWPFWFMAVLDVIPAVAERPRDAGWTLVRSFVSSGAAVDCWQSFDVPSATASAEA